MTKKKPNYTQFMRRPAPLEMSPPSNTDDPRPRSTNPRPRDMVSDEEVPWGEIIVEFGPHDAVPLGTVVKDSARAPRSATTPAQPAPEPVVPPRPCVPPAQGAQDEADVEGLAVFHEPASNDAALFTSEMVEWAFPGPGAPPLVFMAIAIVLMLCLL
jgi:hypothetical protein